MNVARATRSNPFYARRYSWNRWRTQIAALIGSGSSSIESSQFANAVKNWQQSIGLVPADGMLGPETWHRMAREIPGAEIESSASGPGAALRIVSRQGGYLVLNRDAFRREVVQFLWGGGFTPTNEELHSRSSVEHRSELELELPDTHWALPQTRFAARANVYRLLTQTVQQQLSSAPDETARRPPRAPAWVPTDIWNSFLAGNDGAIRYQGASRFGTMISLIKRNGQRSGYTNAPEDVNWLSRRMESHEARMVADANSKFNAFMYLKTDMGMHAGQAHRLFRETVQVGYVSAFISVLGLAGMAGHSGGESIRDAWQASNGS